MHIKRMTAERTSDRSECDLRPSIAAVIGVDDDAASKIGRELLQEASPNRGLSHALDELVRPTEQVIDVMRPDGVCRLLPGINIDVV